MSHEVKIDGADISHHQANPLDYDRAKKAGLKFLYHKATEGTSVVDKKYSQRRLEACKAGVPFGAYHFAHPSKTDAVEEADFFLSVASPQPGDLIPALDIEVNPAGLTQEELTDWVGTFVERIKEKLGVCPIIYTPFNLKSNFGCMLWTARYSDGNAHPVPEQPWVRWDIWQFSNGAYGQPNHLPGFGNVDLNTLNDHVTLEDLIIEEEEVEEELVRTGRIRITTQNVQSLPRMPQAEVVADIELTAKQSTVVLWQEILPERYDKALHALEESGAWETWWGRGRVKDDKVEKGDHNERAGFNTPISWRTRVWEFVEGGSWLLHDGVAKICNDRWVNWVVLRHRKTGAEVYFDNAHYVAGAWSDKPKYAKDQRKEMWLDGYARHVAWIKQQIQEHPERALCLGGDYNAQLLRDGHLFRQKIAGRRLRSGVGKRSIDHLFLINGREWVWDIIRRERMPGRNSDHQGRRVKAVLEER